MISILFQNDDLVICYKPAQVLSVPAREANDGRPCLGLQLQQHFQKQIFPVHRLDYEVSGLMMYALNAKAHKQAQDWYMKKTILKKYKALTSLQDFSHWPQNVPTERKTLDLQIGQKFEWKTQILRGKKRSFESKQGEWAQTIAIVKQVLNDQILWELFPLTGKPHQLRFELSRRGFPIIGDNLYGSKVKCSNPGINLKAIAFDLNQIAISDRLGLPSCFELQAPFASW